MGDGDEDQPANEIACPVERLAHLKGDNSRSSTERSVRSDLLGKRHGLKDFSHGTSCLFFVSIILYDVKVDFDVSCKLSNVNSIEYDKGRG